jgi:hypothetical protein
VKVPPWSPAAQPYAGDNDVAVKSPFDPDDEEVNATTEEVSTKS